MKISFAFQLAALLTLFGVNSLAEDARSRLWGKYEQAPASDGRIKMRAVWVRSSPAREILDEAGVFRLSKIEGYTYEFFVLIENTGKEDVEVPSSFRGASPTSGGMEIRGSVIVPYLIKFDDLQGEIPLVESAASYRPVKLKPGESVRLPIFYRICETLPTIWFFYAVDEDVAKRYGWWSGALKCQGEEYRPNRSPSPR